MTTEERLRETATALRRRQKTRTGREIAELLEAAAQEINRLTMLVGDLARLDRSE